MKTGLHNNEKVWSVSALNTIIRERLQNDPLLQNIWLEGEILNLTKHSSGHIYFSLKDEHSVIQCTFFRGANSRYSGIPLKNGLRVMARGSVTVYLPRGGYQLNVVRVLPTGEGDLRLKIEQLKKKLHHEGLFSPERKRRLPAMPLTLGVVTAPTGAAIQDIIRVSRRRFPDINIILAPCIVQGDEAPSSIISAIEALNEIDRPVDVIIAGRGGGSFEDLLAFNDESVVRAYAASRIPIISAVGHEIDSPLTDLAADASASTPSAAAEMAVPVYDDIIEQLEDGHLRNKLQLHNRQKMCRESLRRIRQSRIWEKPGAFLEMPAQHLDLIVRELKSMMFDRVRENRNRLGKYDTLPYLYQKKMDGFGRRFAVADERLRGFSPLATLKRGYAVVRNEKGRVIRSYREVQDDEGLEILLSEGVLDVRVLNRRTDRNR